MSDKPVSQTATQYTQAGDEYYSIADQQAQVEYVQVRRAAQWVPFFVPHLRSGMRLLDCGCGVGSITLDLAEIVAPGEVVGLDLDASQLALARAAADTRGLTNARFEAGNVYELPFADASFDAVLAHTVLFHLSDQLRALKELRRVLAPGGIIAVSDDHYGTWVVSPEDSAVRRMLTEIAPRVIAASGGAPFYSHNLRRLLLEAGFARTDGVAVAAEQYGTLEETRRFAAVLGRLMRSAELTQLVGELGLASADEFHALSDGVLAWGERPDAFAAVMYCAALGWVDAKAGV